MFEKTRFVLLLLALSLLLGPVARAQDLDLPKSKGKGSTADGKKTPGTQGGKPQRGNLVPHLACTICGQRNYTTAIDPGAEGGIQLTWCTVCRRDSYHRRSGGRRRGGEGLDLPVGLGGTPAEPSPRTEPAPPAPVAAPPAADAGQGSPAARYIFEQMRRRKEWNDELSQRAVDSLVALDAAGRATARLTLFEDDPAVVMTAARVLMRGADPADLDLVVTRVTRRLPTRAAGAMVDELVEGAPVRATPRFLITLLDHDQSGVRASAWRHLDRLVTADHLPDLERALESKRSETRQRAVELIETIDDAAVLDVLLARMADPSARVARAVSEAIASLDDPRVDFELLSRAFSERWILRPSAYALLTIVRREELSLQPILGIDHAEALLGGLSSSNPFVSGTCAAALSGIGFRSRHPKDTAWLDREVVDHLVFAVSGREFHNDFSALIGPATRRLELLTGQSFGTDGPDWVGWWLDAREGFYAHRAWIEVAPEEAGFLVLRHRAGGDDPKSFTIVGPTAAEELLGSTPVTSERFVLSMQECTEVVELLRREGVLGPERLPGRRGSRASVQRTLEVMVRSGGKRFDFGGGIEEPWFERLVSTVNALHERNRWQRYTVRGQHTGTYDLWVAEHAWWDAQSNELERSRRLKELVFASVDSLSPPDRERGIRELEHIYRTDANVEIVDFPHFLGLLRDEGFLSARARSLAMLALRAAGGPGPDREAAPDALQEELVMDLVALLDDRFGIQSADTLAAVLMRCGPEFTRSMAAEDRPLVRAVVATSLGRSQAAEIDERDVVVLIALLADSEPEVQAAAALALGRRGVEQARDELLVQARVGESPVREAALEAVGVLGGLYAFDALVLGLADRNPSIKEAAVRGLSELGDAKAAPLLVSLLGQGPESRVFLPAREGLAKLGLAAHADLLRVANSSSHRARRVAALILSEQSVPEVAPVLMSILTDEADDARVAEELAVLTCADFRTQPQPAMSWWAWWDTVVHDDAVAWYRAALERRGISPPKPEAFQPGGERELAGFLVEVIQRTLEVERESHILERTRRELSRALGRPVPELPAGTSARAVWLEALLEVLEHEWRQ